LHCIAYKAGVNSCIVGEPRREWQDDLWGNVPVECIEMYGVMVAHDWQQRLTQCLHNQKYLTKNFFLFAYSAIIKKYSGMNILIF
jgi:hypothetical protein